MTRSTLTALLFVLGCGGGTPAPTPPSNSATDQPPAASGAEARCPAGQALFVPGCGEGTTFKEGCYAACRGGAACEPGFTCTKVSIDPCAGSECDACGAEAELCLPPS